MWKQRVDREFRSANVLRNDSRVAKKSKDLRACCDTVTKLCLYYTKIRECCSILSVDKNKGLRIMKGEKYEERGEGQCPGISAAARTFRQMP